MIVRVLTSVQECRCTFLCTESCQWMINKQLVCVCAHRCTCALPYTCKSFSSLSCLSQSRSCWLITLFFHFMTWDLVIFGSDFLHPQICRVFFLPCCFSVLAAWHLWHQATRKKAIWLTSEVLCLPVSISDWQLNMSKLIINVNNSFMFLYVILQI